ncbi:non-homologous end-joining DNA ligase LigD [Mesonia aquimarina]|uniref:non-homologous end-joining DNA ligase LigD n=1 Tax=Mesonia aquimarina TaxID=1504967 RepID=UPI000EF5DB22|nr:hypothetical protein [Mesonia aquimarina]
MKINAVKITHPDKLWFPKNNITKLAVIQYYEKIADLMLPYLKNRPLTLHRFPDGIDSKGFYQKNAADYFPDFIHVIQIKTEKAYNYQPMCNNKKSLLYLVNQGTVSFHVWLSQKDKLYKPNKVVFDLDPPENPFKKVKEATKKTVEFFKKKGKKPQLMTTGKKGFHVWYTQRRTKTFEELKPNLKNFAVELTAQNPSLFYNRCSKKQAERKSFY